MRDETVARKYAEALFDLAERHEGLAVFQQGIDTIAELVDSDPKLRLFLETPRIDADDKKKVLRKALAGRVPPMLLNFLLITIDKRRQRLLGSISDEFGALIDEHENRVHVEVTIAKELDADTTSTLGSQLSTMLGKTAVPRYRVDPSILGGVVVKAGDTIYDGSLRRRMETMRRQLMTAALPSSSD